MEYQIERVSPYFFAAALLRAKRSGSRDGSKEDEFKIDSRECQHSMRSLFHDAANKPVSFRLFVFDRSRPASIRTNISLCLLLSALVFTARLPSAMPIYYACGIKVKLLVSPLPISTLTTTDPPDARQNTYERTKSIQQALDKASVLLEEPVPYHGDDRPPYFLEGDTTVPFFMVKVGKVASRPKNTKLQSKEIENEATSSLKITTASAEPSSLPSLPMLPTGRKQHPSNLSAASNTFSKLTEDMNSSLTAQRSAKNYAGQDSLWTHQKALSLDIEFDITRSFKRDRGKNLPIKTEVYINGELASCSYYGLHQRTEKPMKPQRHSGIRTGRVAELPWVLMTRDAPTADGSRPGRTGSDAVKRWMKISAALQVEATNCGHDRKGRQSPSGACLSALASMEIPNSILESVSPGSPSLGIIDVVITRGAGAKAPPEAGHLHKVQRLFDRQYASHAQVLGSAPDVIDLTVEPTPPTNAMETIMPDLLGLDGASDPKTPSHTPKRRATRSSAIVSPSADESEPDAEEKTESRESLGFLAAAQSVDPLLWDIAEPPIAAFAEMMSTKTRYGDLVVFSSDPVRSSPPPLQSLTDVSTGRSNRALARSARVDYSNGKRSRVVKLKNKRPQACRSSVLCILFLRC